VFLVLVSGPQPTFLTSTIRPIFILLLSGLFGLQDIWYIPTTNYSSDTCFSYYMSLTCILGYNVLLFQISRLIFTTGQLLDATASVHSSSTHGPTPSSPSSIQRMWRRTRGRLSIHRHRRRSYSRRRYCWKVQMVLSQILDLNP
jgi:hypothetical protein